MATQKDLLPGFKVGDLVRVKGDTFEGHDRIGKIHEIGTRGGPDGRWVSVVGHFTNLEPQWFPTSVLERIVVLGVPDGTEMDSKTETHWGGQFEDGLVRWDPRYGRDAWHPRSQLVTRKRTTVQITTEWEAAE